MPEGPEIRRAADSLQQQLGGSVLDDVWFAYPSLTAKASSLVGSRVETVESWGKAMLMRFANQQVLYSHNQLYGVWKLHDAHRPPSTKRSLRVRLEAEGRAASLYSASDISLWQADELAQHPFLATLGPDLLSHGVTPNQVRQRLELKAFFKRNLGALLLDQHLVAGLGNYLRSEILFYAQLHPKIRPVDLNSAQLDLLATQIIEVTWQAYRQAGITNQPAWLSQAKAAGEARQQWRFCVFERAGLDCHRCGDVVSRLTVGSRRLYLCPTCQRLP